MIFYQYAHRFNYPYNYIYNRQEQLHCSFIRDLIESGYLNYNLLYEEVVIKRNLNYLNNIITYKLSKLDKEYLTQYISSRIGYCLESFISYYLTMDEWVRLEMIRRCFRNPNKTEEYNKRCVPINLGSYSTNMCKPELFDTQDPHFDIIFAKNNKQGITPIKNSKSGFDNVGFQIKAIKSSTTSKIISPINQRKYPIVLTLLELENEYGDIIHTKARCITTINSDKQQFNKRQREYLIDSIVCPEDIGIPQWIINQYYDYMFAAFNNEYDFSQYILNGIYLYNNYLNYLCTNIFNKALQIEQISMPIINQDNNVEIELSVN